jgi:hypothetical protein
MESSRQFWFVGSVIMGRLYDASLPALIVFSVVTQLLAIPVFMIMKKRL